MISRLYSIKIYNNISDTNFITSDDPCFNQKFNKNEFHVQLPISPKVMIELVANPYEETDNVILTEPLVTFHELEETEVIELNKKIFENKDRFVYAQTAIDIESIS
mgnify:CR=1 FL=1